MKTIEKVEALLRCIVLAALSLLLLGGFDLELRAPRIIHSEAEATRAALTGEAHAAIVDANARVADAVAKADTQITAALGEVRLASANANRRTSEALSIARMAAANTGVTLANAETDLNHLTRNTNAQMDILNATLAITLKPVRESAQQVDEALPLYLDCNYNPDCAFNRFQGVSKAVEQTSITIAKAAPSLVASADKIAASSVDTSAAVATTGKEVAIAAKRFNAPQTKWQAFRMWLLTAARIAGEF